MKAGDLTTPSPDSCTASTLVRDVARMMLRRGCGAIPVVDSLTSSLAVGIVTDRDITCRVVAAGLDPGVVTAGDCMSSPLATVSPDASLEDCVIALIDAQVRRLVVVDRHGRFIGILALADLASAAPERHLAALMRSSARFDPDPSRLLAAI